MFFVSAFSQTSYCSSLISAHEPCVVNAVHWKQEPVLAEPLLYSIYIYPLYSGIGHLFTSPSILLAYWKSTILTSDSLVKVQLPKIFQLFHTHSYFILCPLVCCLKSCLHFSDMKTYYFLTQMLPILWKKIRHLLLLCWLLVVSVLSSLFLQIL